MNDGIKKILDNFKDYELRYKQCNENQFIIFYRDIHLLLDYITNLQQENERLKQDYINVKNYIVLRKVDSEVQDKATLYNIELENINKKRYEDYKSRIEKAVEYMKKHIEKCNIDGYEGKFDNFDIFTKPQELLNILLGRSL